MEPFVNSTAKNAAAQSSTEFTETMLHEHQTSNLICYQVSNGGELMEDKIGSWSGFYAIDECERQRERGYGSYDGEQPRDSQYPVRNR